VQYTGTEVVLRTRSNFFWGMTGIVIDYVIEFHGNSIQKYW
jgi:hypothetical protein